MEGKDLLVLGLVGVGGYFLYEWWMGQLAPAAAAAPVPTPGTTGVNQPTSVSTAPATTPPPANTGVPGSMQSLATNMAQNINMTVADADQWDYAFRNIMGQHIWERYPGFNFDAVYGPVTGAPGHQVRNYGATMNALLFLQMAAASIPGGLPGFSGLGIGKIRTFSGPFLNTSGNMIYRAHHPMPYAPSYSLKGMGAATQATGFEKTLFANRPLRSARVQ